VLGISLPLSGAGNRLQIQPAGGTPNAWLRIGGDNSITMVVDRAEMGQGVYTALPVLLAEELEVPVERLAIEFAPPGAAYVNGLLGAQLTGGSTSVRDAWEKLRRAGAQARTMLVAAAAGQWGVGPAACRVEDGTIVGPDGRRLTYGEVAEAASTLAPPKDVKLKPPGEFRLVGKPIRRLDTPAKVDGSAQFGIDVKLPGMLHGALAQCPVLGGRARGVDDAAARAMPGVREVVQTSFGVMVVAEHFWQALKARDALKIDWDEGANAKLDNAAIRATLRKGSEGPGLNVRKDGDTAAALKAAQRRLRATYELPMLAHATMEPMNCTADVRADGCDVYVGTQGPPFVQAAAAQAAGIDPKQVRVHTTFLGGGFGRRFELDFVIPTVEASKKLGRPVKLIWTREDDTTHDVYRPPAWDEAEAALDAAGNPIAVRLHLTAPSVTARLFPAAIRPDGYDLFQVEAAQNYLYDVPNVSVDFVRQDIGINLGYWRSVSHAMNCFVVESFMDELAKAAGKDPYTFRHALLGRQPRARRVLEQAAELGGWGKARAGRTQGLAVMEGYGSYLAQLAEVSVGKKGEVKVHRIACAVDCGRMVNPSIVQAQVESAIVFGLSAALWGEITLKDGRVQQRNFQDYRVLRLNDAPVIDVRLLPGEDPPGGMGEPATALVAPAVCNAIAAATGRRIRALPIARQPGLRA
jgi:isoquinoline 1-oxidoreductase beta subunit